MLPPKSLQMETFDWVCNGCKSKHAKYNILRVRTPFISDSKSFQSGKTVIWGIDKNGILLSQIV